MIFYRSSHGGQLRSRSTLQGLTLTALVAYPIGAVLNGPLDAGKFVSLGGLALMLVAFVATALIATSDLQRIVGEEENRLDEYELHLRHRALSRSYACFGGLVLVAIIYAALAGDFGWWLPYTYEHWSGVFWGAFLYATLLPTAALVWFVLPAEEREDGR